MRFLTRSLIGVFLFSLTIGLVALAGGTVWSALQDRWSQESRERPARERVFAVGVVEVTPETVTPTLTAFGEVLSRRRLELRASAPGEVVFLHEAFEEGGRVAEGEVLLRIDPADATSARDLARADLREAEAELREATRALDIAADELAAAADQATLRRQAVARQQDLLRRGVGTDAAVETADLARSAADQAVLARRQAQAQAEARIDQAGTALDRRRIALAEAERRLDETELTAGFTGVLSGVSVVVGGLVGGNERLGELIDPDRLEVGFRLSTSQYLRLLGADGRLVGAPVTASLDVLGVDLVAEGTISRESGAVAEGETGRLLFARLAAPEGLRPGDFVTVEIEEPPLEGVALLPSAALDATGTVLVIGPEDRLEAAPVELLRRQGDNVIVRAAGIEGREVVSARTPLLGAGIRVRPVRPEAAADPAEDTVRLDPERRARLVAFVEASAAMPDEAKARLLDQLSQDQVPARTVANIESRMGG